MASELCQWCAGGDGYKWRTGRPVACQRLYTLGSLFLSHLLMTAQRMKGSRTCTGTAGRKVGVINVGDCSSA